MLLVHLPEDNFRTSSGSKPNIFKCIFFCRIGLARTEIGMSWRLLLHFSRFTSSLIHVLLPILHCFHTRLLYTFVLVFILVLIQVLISGRCSEVGQPKHCLICPNFLLPDNQSSSKFSSQADVLKWDNLSLVLSVQIFLVQ